MPTTVWAVIRDGKIELVEQIALPEGAKALVTLLSDDEAAFWRGASEESLEAVWNNEQDDTYAQLLAK